VLAEVEGTHAVQTVCLYLFLDCGKIPSINIHRCMQAVIIIIIIFIIGSTALGGPWPSLEALPIRLFRERPSSNS